MLAPGRYDTNLSRLSYMMCLKSNIFFSYPGEALAATMCSEYRFCRHASSLGCLKCLHDTPSVNKYKDSFDH